LIVPLLRLSRGLRLLQASERELTVLLLVLLAMGVRTEFALRQALKQRKLFSAIQTPHVCLIVPFLLMLKTDFRPFDAVKYLVQNFLELHLRQVYDETLRIVVLPAPQDRARRTPAMPVGSESC
jgi:hypothetical protein